MNRYFVLFSIPAKVVEEWKRNTPPEKMKAASDDMMGAWQKWMEQNGKSIVDRGTPLGKTKRVSAQGVSDIRNDLNWYLIVDADSHNAAAKMFATHPHLQIPEASIEVMEVPHPPGM
jgi:hypothetical protein